ncbi:pogo transposable element with KRAB domain [Rhizophagus irregularis DAOM 181602=DAOM 197198]|nr:pogo transposable element with KRAB domain [Rhizophagus irregularis DAOM 181602=DAOM 197198]
MKVGSGQKAFYPETEKKLYNWIIEQRMQGLAMTYTTAKFTMFDILEEPEMIALYGNSTEKFKASFRWLTLFMKRIQKSFEFSNIFNMDETPVWFDMAGNFTINVIGDKTVHIHRTNGSKLPLICIFKKKKKPRGEQFPDGVIVWFQENGWMDANIMKNYIDYLVEEVDEPELLKMMVYDSFREHLEESVKKKFRENGFNLAVIPGGLTSICQPLDVAINKPFKDNLRREWHLWIANGGAGQTAAGNL